jgi:hypothetical protein
MKVYGTMTYQKLQAVAIVGIVGIAVAGRAAPPASFHNLLRNPTLEFYSPAQDRESSPCVTCWNTDRWGDVTSIKGSNSDKPPVETTGNAVRIGPGKRFWQLASLPDLGLINGDVISLAVKAYQEQRQGLQARLCLMLIESADGTWAPGDFGLHDKRTFARHGRGELVRFSEREASSERESGEFLLKMEGLKIDALFKDDKQSASTFRNVVGVLVEFANVSAQDVWIHSPTLVRGPQAVIDVSSSRPLPEYYRQIPQTIQKLVHGQPLHILTLGSSIDRGSANPPFYLYDEDRTSAHYKQPLCECRPSDRKDIAALLAQHVGRPDLQNYIGWWQHYFMYTGQMRLELMRKFNYPVDKILLNVMACDGSSIGESHSGFRAYAELDIRPEPNLNGTPSGSKWSELYPTMFQQGKKPVPDLVVFGHGHNEHIDRPDEVDAYEGAIRWFQRHYPGVEFVCCMWIRDTGEPNSMSEPMRKLCRYYGIPFVDVGQMLNELKKTCNSYALAVDGGHPGAAGHQLWFKQLEQVFEVPPEAMSGIAQNQLPQRMNAYTYGWEGDITRFQAPASRIVSKRMMIIEDCAFNVWADNQEQLMELRIDGRPSENAGHGRHGWTKLDPRNSTFVHGHLALGDRHIIEVLGTHARLVAVDCKVCPNRDFIAADSDSWHGERSAVPFASEWGAPYGQQMFRLSQGESVEIELEATDLSIAYIDRPGGGTLRVEVDGVTAWSRPTSIPFRDSANREYYIENRRGVTGLEYRSHRIRLIAETGAICVLGIFTYDSRS